MDLFLQKQTLWTFTTPLCLLTSINVLIFQTKAVWALVLKRRRTKPSSFVSSFN